MTRGPLLVAMLQETGHLNPSFKLLRGLRNQGHDVRYLAAPALRAHIENEGLGTLPLFPELSEQAEPDAGNVLTKRRAITQRFEAMVSRLVNGGPDLFGERPGLALVDVTQTHIALWARKAGIPLVLLNTSLPQTHDDGVPPLRSALMFDPSLAGRARSELVWQKFLIKRRLSAQLVAPLGMRPPYDVARKVAVRFGVPSRELDCQTVYMPQLKGVLELVLCPPQLDFPRPQREGRHYVESIDLTRKEATFDWSRVDGSKPLVYCALGGQLYRAGQTKGFLQRVVDVFGKRPHLQLVIATGKHMRPEELSNVSENVLAMERAPQLTLLQRAKLMITHGGLGSVKECAIHGVPMLVFPLDIDQPGNAARVAFHGVGLAGDIVKTSADELGAMIDRVLAEPSFLTNVTRLKGQLEAHEQTARGVELVTQQLR